MIVGTCRRRSASPGQKARTRFKELVRIIVEAEMEALQESSKIR
ncbi:MAG: hypothetical protein AABX97_08745 [Candidatus Thermoplasmatota archaeon]